MRKITMTAFVSLDGVMQAPGGPDEDPTGGFKLGGWSAPYWDDALAEVLAEAFAKPFDLVLGRKTYEIFAAHWPFVERNPASKDYDAGMATTARALDTAVKYVASRSMSTFSWENSRSLGSDPVAMLRAVKQGEGPDLVVQGSSDFAQTLLVGNLVDELRLLIYPVVLGRGKRLFGTGTVPAAFNLSRFVVSPSGVLITTYQRSGEVATGSFAFETPTDAEAARRKRLGH